MAPIQAYRLIGPYSTFEEYVKDIEGLAITTAQDKIKAYLVHKAINENVGPEISDPGTEYQVAQLYKHETAISKFKTEKRIVTTKDGEQHCEQQLPRRCPTAWLSADESCQLVSYQLDNFPLLYAESQFQGRLKTALHFLR